MPVPELHKRFQQQVRGAVRAIDSCSTGGFAASCREAARIRDVWMAPPHEAERRARASKVFGFDFSEATPRRRRTGLAAGSTPAHRHELSATSGRRRSTSSKHPRASGKPSPSGTADSGADAGDCVRRGTQDCIEFVRAASLYGGCDNSPTPCCCPEEDIEVDSSSYSGSMGSGGATVRYTGGFVGGGKRQPPPPAAGPSCEDARSQRIAACNRYQKDAKYVLQLACECPKADYGIFTKETCNQYQSAQSEADDAWQTFIDKVNQEISSCESGRLNLQDLCPEPVYNCTDTDCQGFLESADSLCEQLFQLEDYLNTTLKMQCLKAAVGTELYRSLAVIIEQTLAGTVSWSSDRSNTVRSGGTPCQEWADGADIYYLDLKPRLEYFQQKLQSECGLVHGCTASLDDLRPSGREI